MRLIAKYYDFNISQQTKTKNKRSKRETVAANSFDDWRPRDVNDVYQWIMTFHMKIHFRFIFWSQEKSTIKDFSVVVVIVHLAKSIFAFFVCFCRFQLTFSFRFYSEVCRLLYIKWELFNIYFSLFLSLFCCFSFGRSRSLIFYEQNKMW